MTDVTLEWFGVTTYRLRAAGLTIFLDAWLDKPKTFESHISLETAINDGVDYIFISHAHFDHLPGAADLAKATGATIIANCEAISLCRAGGVPDSQLMRVSGGERIPLFTKQTLDAASTKQIELAPDLPNAKPRPHPKFAVMTVEVWPGLHCLLPNAPAVTLPDELDSAAIPDPPSDAIASKFASTADITQLMYHGLIKMSDLVSESDRADPHIQSLLSWLETHSELTHGCLSACDGGNLMYNILVPTSTGDKTLLWNAQLGYYPGILSALDPKPDFAILSVAGQGNLNGRPVSHSPADFVVQELKVLGEPERVMWCLCDELPIKPFRSLTTGRDGVTEKVGRETQSQVVSVSHGEMYKVW